MPDHLDVTTSARGFAHMPPIPSEYGDLRKFGPKAADHPSCGRPCPACHEPFAAGDFTTLIMLGPGSDPEAREKARDGRPYTAAAVEVHWSCATGELP